MSIELTGVVIELAIWFLAAHLVWSLQMTLRKRIYILSAFGVKLLSVQALGHQILRKHLTLMVDSYFLSASVFTI